MTNKERYRRTCLCQKADRAPYNFYFGPWGETLARWQKEGLGENNSDWVSPFGFDAGILVVPANCGPCPAFEHKVLETKEHTMIISDHFGVIQEVSRRGPTIPKYLKFPVNCIDDWIAYKKERFDPENPERFAANFAEIAENINRYDGAVQLNSYPHGVFGTPRELMGLENLMFAFYDDPELVHMVMDDLTDFWLAIYEKACAYVKVDIIHIWEDMSGKQGCLISPSLMREFMVPNYKKIREFAERHDIHTVMLDTDGNVDELIDVYMEGGINALMPFEVRAGSDIVKYREKYPSLCIMGGIDKTEIARGREAIDAELMRIAPMLDRPGYMPALDHLPHPDISWDDFCYFNHSLKKLIFSKASDIF